MTTATIKKLSICLVLVICVCGPAAFGEVRLPKIFTDHMVLQQELPIAVWGWGDKGEKVTVTLAGKSVETKADAAGRWRVDIPAMKADGKTHTLTVKGANTIELKDILLGEVWLCAGQSNMNRSTEVKDSDNEIRLFWIDGSVTPLAEDLGDNAAGWVHATPKDVAAATPPKRGRSAGKPRKSFAEVGYVFGRKLHAELKVPVGLIKCAFGGSQVQSWTPVADVEKLYPFGKPAEGGYIGHRPGLLYQTMVNGIVPLTMRGVIWYQGEND
jgi:sialate O-acetylesterase